MDERVAKDSPGDSTTARFRVHNQPMPKPIAICIEDLAPGSSPRYVRCVARAGRNPGLCLDDSGGLLWMSDGPAACELCVSMDDKLILYRRTGGAPITVRREERSLDVPAEKPVVLLDRDRVEVGSRKLRVHVHGPTGRVFAPSPLPEPGRGGAARAAATVAVLGAAFGATDCKKADSSAASDAGTAGPTAPSEAGAAVEAVIVVPSEAGIGGVEVSETPPGDQPTGEAPDASAAESAGAAADAGAGVDVGPDVGPDAGEDVYELEIPGDAFDGNADDDGRRIRDAQRIEVRVHPPVARPPRDAR